MKNKQNQKNNSIVIAIIAVMVIIGIVGGSTYAYWTWTTATNQQTNIGFAVANQTSNGDLSASISGGGTTEVSSLIPTNSCESANALKKAVVITYKNDTVGKARINAFLNVTNFIANSAPTSDNLSHLHWAVTTTNWTDSSTVGCSTGVISSGIFTGANQLLSSDTSFKTPSTIEINVNEGTSTAQTAKYYVYVWLDSGYVHQNIGSTNSDPMQGLTFKLTWSGTITQVSSFE